MGNAPSKVTQQDKAILQVKLQRDKMTKYQKSMSYNIGQEKIKIKEYLIRKDKNSAKIILKRIKYQEKLIDSLNDQMMNLENMIRTLEFKLIEKEFLNGLSKGNELLKKLNNELSINKVEDLLDDVRENIEIQQEIDNLLSNSVIGKDFNDEIDEELEELEKQELLKQTGELPSVVGLPVLEKAKTSELSEVPVEEPVVKPVEKIEQSKVPLLA